MAAQESRTIKGIVTDADTDLPVAAVVCIADNSSNYTMTDDFGAYTIEVGSKTKTLTFSILGYQTVTVDLAKETGKSNTVNVRLYIDSQSIEETVVVGYGSQKKSDITGAVGSVSRDRIQSSTVTDVAQMIQGSVPGL
ncbi:MAG: carboxypeptidase-like regulatory domain-containing protein, partial [Candidatus Cryptobacteroides sp.]